MAAGEASLAALQGDRPGPGRAPAARHALHLQADLENALLAGVDPQEVRPLQDRLARITPAGSWEDPVRAGRQLHELGQLHTAVDSNFTRLGKARTIMAIRL